MCPGPDGCIAEAISSKAQWTPNRETSIVWLCDHPVGEPKATAPSKQDTGLTASGRRDTPDLGGRTDR